MNENSAQRIPVGLATNINFPVQEIIVELLKDAMLQHPQSPGFLIDGFPRELGQAKQFENEVALKTISTEQ